ALSRTRTHPLHHHPNRLRSGRAHGKFTWCLSFTKKDRRARIARALGGRYPDHRFDVERMRASLAPGRRALSLRRDRCARIIMAIFKKPAIKIQGRKKRDIPQGLFQKCPGCDEVVHELELIENQRICPHCDYHFPQTAKERIESLLDPGSFVEMDANLHSIDTLRFQGMASY